MKVIELIKALLEFDKDTEVYFEQPNNIVQNISEIRISNATDDVNGVILSE